MKISPAKTAYALIVLCGLLYAFVVLRGPNGLPGLLAKRQLVHEFEQGNQQLHTDIEKKQARIERLKENSTDMEREIRERLKLANPGEKIYIIDEKKK